MSIAGPIVISIMLLGAAFTMRDVRRLWRHQASVFDAPFPYWIWGAPAWRAARRAAPVTIVLGFPIILAILIVMISQDSGVDGVARGFAIYASAVDSLLMIVTAAFARPLSLIPPHLRAEPGFLLDLMNRRHGHGPPTA